MAGGVVDDEELDENDDGAGVERNPTADKIPGGIDAEREDEPGEADRKPINGRRLHGCTSFPEMGKVFYRDMTPVFAIIPSQFRDGFGCRSNVSLSQQANPNVGANEPHS